MGATPLFKRMGERGTLRPARGGAVFGRSCAVAPPGIVLCLPASSFYFAHMANENRMTEAEALRLFQEAPLDELMARANLAKEERHGKQVFWVNNRQINYTNVCVLHCRFCAFSKIKKDSAVAYDWDVPTILAKAGEAVERGARELHIVGGLHPDHPFSYYVGMLRELRVHYPQVNLKCFTAVELCHFAKLEGRSLESVILELKQAGLDALPGGGAEILVPGIREEICGDKESGAEWLAAHRTAHRMGVPSNATMLFGHIETFEHRVRHMAMLRELQDETNGFFAFIPLVYHPDKNALGKRVPHKTPPEDILRTVAIARLFLDNFPHIKAYWVQMGLATALQALHGGASDLDGTIIEEKITRAAGAEGPPGMTAERMMEAIRAEGLEPVERNALYRSSF